MRIGAVALMIIMRENDIVPCSRRRERRAKGIDDQTLIVCRGVAVLVYGHTESMSGLWCVLRVVSRFVLLG